MRPCSICLAFTWLALSLACSGPAPAPVPAPDPALDRPAPAAPEEVAEATPAKPPRNKASKAQKECFVDGATQCNGDDLMQCADGVWQRLNTCPCQQSIGDDGVTFAYCLD